LCGFCKKKFAVVERAFLLRVSEFWGVFLMVNRGEFVVVCVANCGVSQPLNWGLKIRHIFELYFEGRQRGIRGLLKRIPSLRNDKRKDGQQQQQRQQQIPPLRCGMTSQKKATAAEAAMATRIYRSAL